MLDIAWFPLFVTIYGIAGIVCAVAAYILARRKHRDRETWAFACFFVPPLFLILLYLKPLKIIYARPVAYTSDDDDDDSDGDRQATNIATRL